MIKKRKNPTFPPIECGDCGATTIKKSASQRYCKPCSEKRDLQRKATYQNAKGKQLYDARQTQWGAIGTTLSLDEQLNVVTSTPAMPSMAWYKRVEMPFSWAGSKNHLFASTQRGHVYMREESRYMRSKLTSLIYEAAKDVNLVQNKLWIDIYVQKPSQKGDAVNFVDMVCDAVKDGLALDDRWFSLRSVDWQIAKFEPKLFVGIGQETAVNVQACSSCGRLLTFDYFQKNRALANGIGRNCRDCQATTRNSKKRNGAQFLAAIEHKRGIFG